MKNKAIELLETKIWLIHYEQINEYYSPERIEELMEENCRLHILLARLKS